MTKIEQLKATKKYLQEKGITSPEIGIVLGTGLGKLLQEISIEITCLKEMAWRKYPFS